MALFNKEPEKNVKPQQPAAAPQPPVMPSTPAPQTAAVDSKAPAPKPVPAGDVRAYLDSGSRINGKVNFESPARIDGQVEGEITAKESLVIGDSAVITAQIKASSIIVAGKVSGDIIASQRLEIRPSARVIGNLTAPVLIVHEGAMFEGHCSMQPEGAREDRKVAVFPKEERLNQVAQKQA